MSKRKYGGNRSFELPPGVSGYLQLGMEFCQWAQKLNRKITHEDVMSKYGVPTKTAYVWIQRWNAANGVYE